MPILFYSQMTRKKKNELAKSPQNSSEWQALLQREGLLLLDIYPGWAGPTSSINFFINKFNVELQVNSKKVLAVIRKPEFVLKASASRPLIQGIHAISNCQQSGEDWERGEVLVRELLRSARAGDVQGPVPPCLRHDLSRQGDSSHLELDLTFSRHF